MEYVHRLCLKHFILLIYYCTQKRCTKHRQMVELKNILWLSNLSIHRPIHFKSLNCLRSVQPSYHLYILGQSNNCKIVKFLNVLLISSINSFDCWLQDLQYNKKNSATTLSYFHKNLSEKIKRAAWTTNKVVIWSYFPGV